ncbi:hypothetical protein JWG45_10560 [Leptospira sp. 201903070]|uniref:Uncharacterized protein n=1 Tax=Leptospira ainlahdjerensis TaxID=2810033 RepID=A0ABS2UCU5_9LEPT|nr:hypothetical protein [Leptospira ainlahdjerensis]MBM9577594.1 hypothetical protein [Leptospira ainlahdjerensis]
MSGSSEGFVGATTDTPSVKVARPTLILGGGVGGGRIPETFLYHKIKLFARKNSHVGIPTKYLLSGRSLLYLLATLGKGSESNRIALKQTPNIQLFRQTVRTKKS